MKLIDRPTATDLEKVGIALVRHDPLTLRCIHCGVEWHVPQYPRSRRPRKYWICTNGCNAQPHCGERGASVPDCG
jgi:hypothetical protein